MVMNSRIINVDKGISRLCGDKYINTPGFWTESDTDDGIHPNLLGYSKIVKELKSKRKFDGGETVIRWKKTLGEIYRVFVWSFQRVGNLI